MSRSFTRVLRRRGATLLAALVHDMVSSERSADAWELFCRDQRRLSPRVVTLLWPL
jgi:hypothetical protein